MNEDQLVGLAEQIARGLPEVKRNDWLRWAQLADTYGLERAVQWAQRMSQDVTLRPAVKHANQLIANGMRSHVQTLKRLPAWQRRKLMGYVAQVLAVETVSGSAD